MPFDASNAERISRGNLFIDRTIPIDDTLVRRWRDEIKAQLDDDVNKLIKNWFSGDNILSTCQFYMVGKKRGDTLIVQPTIVILCATKKCKNILRKELLALKLYHLDNFAQNIKVCYKPLISLGNGIS